MSEYFIFNGIKSTDFGLEIVNDKQLNKSISPSKITTTEKISGVNGEMIFDQTYGTRTISIKCYLNNTDLSNVRQMMTWLGEKYAQELILSYQPYKVYTALFQHEITMKEYLNGGMFILDFICYTPFAKSLYSTLDIINNIEYDEEFLYDSGLFYVDDEPLQYEWNSITGTTNMDIYNASNVNGCAPEIIINGSASNIIITQYYDSGRTQIKDEIQYGNFSGELLISSLLKNTFLNGSVDNTTFQGEYFELEKEQYNYFTISGTSLNISSLKWDFNYIYL